MTIAFRPRHVALSFAVGMAMAVTVACSADARRHTNASLSSELSRLIGIGTGDMLAKYIRENPNALTDFEVIEKMSVLHLAARSATEDRVFDIIIGHGVDVNSKTIVSGQTPLHYAVIAGNEPCVRYLVDHGASVNVTDSDGVTPLYEAVCRVGLGGNFIILEVLLNRKADASIRNNKGENWVDLVPCAVALDDAIRILDIMNKHQVDLTARGRDGQTLFHRILLDQSRAPENWRDPMANWLIRHGVNPHITNSAGVSAVELAKELYGDEFAAQLVLQPGEARVIEPKDIGK